MVDKLKKNPGESIRQKLKNLSIKNNRPFDEILRYYAIERFLYRLSKSKYANRFFLKGALILKVLDKSDHRPTLDIDLLARVSNRINNMSEIIKEVSAIDCSEDAIKFNTDGLIIRETQIGREYHGISASFLAQLNTSKIPMLIDVGFDDILFPYPQEIEYPTLLLMPAPILMGYKLETVVAEKLESIIKLGLVNTRMKDFYDLWKICKNNMIDLKAVTLTVEAVFKHRGTKLEYPLAFTEVYFNDSAVKKQWKAFISSLNREEISFQTVIEELVITLAPVFKS